MRTASAWARSASARDRSFAAFELFDPLLAAGLGCAAGPTLYVVVEELG